MGCRIDIMSLLKPYDDSILRRTGLSPRECHDFGASSAPVQTSVSVQQFFNKMIIVNEIRE